VARRHGVQTLRREDGRIVCEKVKVADTWMRRTRGLLLRRTLPGDEGCVLRPSFSIHTAFMQFPLDVVFLDHDLVVQKISANVRPFHATSSRGAREVVELRAGECARRGLTVGDRVAWASYHATDANAAEPYNSTTTVCRAGQILIASRDSRFVKLMRFLLESRGLDSVTEVEPDALVPALASLDPSATIVLDAGTSTADALTTASVVRARKPHVTLLLAAENDVVKRAPAGTRLYDKWNEMDTLVDLAANAAEQPSPI
jgi:uncharacterized membrane protein (UPF0127 family)/CheY-like chemotaxis protein